VQDKYGKTDVASWEEEQRNLARAELQAMEAEKQARMAEKEEQVGPLQGMAAMSC
jgi:hypothetical protein